MRDTEKYTLLIGAILIGPVLSGSTDGEFSTLAESNERAENVYQTAKSRAVISSSARKPLPPISIAYEIIGEPVVGRPLQIEITAGSRAPMADVEFEIHAEERLALSSVSTNRNIPESRREEAAVRTLTVTPLVEGVLEVAVLARAMLGDTVQARSIVIPIRVGARALSGSHESLVRVDDSGERVISLPADESR